MALHAPHDMKNKSMKNKKIILAFLLVVFLAASLMMLGNSRQGKTGRVVNSGGAANAGTACIKEACFSVETASSPEELARGLMFREHLDYDKGMLFIFKTEGRHSFWMKNTLIPLDIIWINSEKEIVFIFEDAQPCKNEPCPSIVPDKDAKYVLELNSGAAETFNFSLGDTATIS